MINNENILSTIDSYQGFDSNIGLGFDTKSYGYLFILNNNLNQSNSSDDKFYIQDFIDYSGIYYFAFDNRKLLIEKINNGVFTNVELSLSKKDIYQSSLNNSALLSNFTTQQTYLNNLINFSSSSQQITLNSICPQYEFIAYSSREYLDYNLIDYKSYYSLELYNDVFITGYNYVKTINSLDTKPSSILFGGLPLNNDVFIDSFWMNDKFNYNICAYNVFNGVPIFGGFIVQTGVLLNNTNISSSGALNRSYPFQSYGSCDYLNYLGNKSIRYKLNHLNHVYTDSYQSTGYIEFDYSFIKGYGSGITDFYPKGFEYLSGNSSFQLAIIPDYRFYDFSFQTYDYQYSSSVYTNGTLTLPTNIQASSLEAILSPLSPYGVKCFGNTLEDMYIITKGNIDSTNIANGLNGDSFDYNFVLFDLSVKNNFSKSKYVSHGELDLSGRMIWSSNHGPDMLPYSTGDSKVHYQRPSRIGEIFRVQYDNISKQSFFTGNLINFVNLKNSPYQNYYYPTSVMDYDISGNSLGLYQNFIPSSQFISNGFIGSGIIESKLNKQSLAYIQGQINKLVCGEIIYVDSGLLHYSGDYPPFYPGLYSFSQAIFTTGVQ